MNYLNNLHPRSAPGSANKRFHALPGQDDWTNDQSGVEYHHIVGERSQLDTITEVHLDNKVVCTTAISPACERQVDRKVFRGQGDGTVPTLSASRVIPTITNINAPNSKRWYLFSLNEQNDYRVEHTGLTQEPLVHNLLLYLLGLGSKPDGFQNDLESGAKNDSRYFKENFSSFQIAKGPMWRMDAVASQASNQRQYKPSYYITAVNTGFVSIADATGNESKILDDTFASTIPGVSYDLIGDDSFAVTMPTNQEYTLKFKTSGKPMFLEIIKGVGNKTPDMAIRYQDLALPANVNVMLKVTLNGIEDLRYDADGDGVFESTVAPTVSVSGAMANDVTPPIVSVNSAVQQGQTIISITATDAESGVKRILYSLDGSRYQNYTSPFTLNTCQSQTVSAFAEDNVANRSSLVSYTISNRPPDVSQARPSVTSIFPANHKMVSVSIQGITDPDCDAVTIRIDRIMQDELVNGTGDGDTCPDATGIGTSTAQLRAERSGNGNGRVYTIFFTATDSKGNSSQGSVKVSVTKNAKDTAVDDGAKYDSTKCP